MRTFFLASLLLLCNPAYAEPFDVRQLQDVWVVHETAPCMEFYDCLAVRKEVGDQVYILVLHPGTKDIEYIYLEVGETMQLLWWKEDAV
jgi:hypothetical protein